MPAQSFIWKFREEFDRHIGEKKCPYGNRSERYDADTDHQWNDRGCPQGRRSSTRERGRRRDPPLLLPPEAFGRRKLPDVPRGGRKVPKLQTACSTVVNDGMVVRTDTEKVRKAVTGVLELMLIHHPIDCPICDQAGSADCRTTT